MTPPRQAYSTATGRTIFWLNRRICMGSNVKRRKQRFMVKTLLAAGMIERVEK